LGANGFNIPSLFSVFETAPYFYSGLAQTLEDVLNGSQDGNGGVRHHFVTSAQQRADLIRFLNSIDPVLSPEEAIEQLEAKVQDLVSAGILNHGEGNSLLVKLEAAEASIERGNTNSAFNQLGAFINEVEALVRSGRLTSDMGQMLIDLARTAQAGLPPPSRRGPKNKMEADGSSVEDDTSSAGQVSIGTVTSEAKPIRSDPRFTINLPGAPDTPAINSPLDGAVVSTSSLVVRWNHVTTTLTGAPITRTGYEVKITKDVPDDVAGVSRPTFDVRVSPSVKSLKVPGKFLEPNTKYKLELLALEVKGKQTISTIHFATQ
jgi:hypothetical protein